MVRQILALGAALSFGATNAAVMRSSSSTFLGTEAGQRMQPDVVAATLARVEDDWRKAAADFMEGDASTAAQAPGSFDKSCATVVSAVIQGSGGDRAVAKEYMTDVCNQKVLAGWYKDRCTALASSITDHAMVADSYANRQNLNTAKVCTGYWSTFVTAEKNREVEEAKERAEQAKKRAEQEMQATVEEMKQLQEQNRAAEEAQKKAEADAKVWAAKLEKEEAKAHAAIAAEAAKKEAEEAKKRAAEAAARMAEKKAEAEKMQAEAKAKMAEAEEAEKEHQALVSAHKQAEEVLHNASTPVATNSSVNVAVTPAPTAEVVKPAAVPVAAVAPAAPVAKVSEPVPEVKPVVAVAKVAEPVAKAEAPQKAKVVAAVADKAAAK